MKNVSKKDVDFNVDHRTYSIPQCREVAALVSDLVHPIMTPMFLSKDDLQKQHVVVQTLRGKCQRINKTSLHYGYFSKTIIAINNIFFLILSKNFLEN